MDYPIPNHSKHLHFSQYISFFPNTFEFDFNYEKNSNDVNSIPRILHIIWVGERDPPSYVFENIKQWTKLMPNWKIMFWTNNDLTTKHFPLDIIYLLDKVKQGAQKADIMRYYIMEKYGGVYVDTDVTPYHSFDPLITQLPNTEAIICHDLDLTCEYISIGFFAAIPNHPIFVKTCELCQTVSINTDNIYMVTGPKLLGDAVSITPVSTKTVLLPSKFFYRNMDFEGRFGNHFYAQEWV